jgi:nucleoside-diphosphate kinase
VVDGSRVMIGATNPTKAEPGSIRGDYAQTIGRNLVHGSDSAASAVREIAIWFEPSEIVKRSTDNDRWLIAN